MGREQQFLKGVNSATKVYVHKVWKDEHKKLRSDLEKLNKEIEETLYEKSYRVFLCHRKLRPVTQKRSAGCVLARRRNMLQATALDARMCQGTFYFILCTDMSCSDVSSV